MSVQVIPASPFGTLLGYAPGGIAIYSSDYASINPQDYPDDTAFRSYLGREYMGYKWQCVEFARRYLYLNYGLVFTDVAMAYEIFSLRFLRQVINDAIVPLQAFPNGSQQAPHAGALLIWQQGGEFQHTGHVAIITEVLADKVRIAEQNVIHVPLPSGQQWTRELALTVTENGYCLQDSFDDTEILGWMIQTAPNQYSLPQPITTAEKMGIHPASLVDRGQFKANWLNPHDPLQQAYISAMHGHCINRGSPYRYFSISESAEHELVRATNELHLMYLHATDKVLKDDQLLSRFNIPKILWPRLRLSWQNRRYETITGRLDFCMDERGLKVYEYNADSASCHAETGAILPLWAAQAGLQLGTDPGANLLDNLVDCWKHSKAPAFVHLMQDNASEENYHTLFMQQALTQAGFQSKIIHGLEGLQWDAYGRLVDDENRQVRCVWKTWAWETVLEQMRQEYEEGDIALPIRTGHPQNKMRLIDVLLRPEVMVFEPLWTLIPSNKAILPVLWSLFPGHRYLLAAEFEVNEQLQQSGYARKPIAGRCGDNIKLVGHTEQVLDRTDGRFAEQDNIYQQLWCLPKVADLYLQVCTFTVGGHYGGACLRGDSSRVITGDSDLQPLRILADCDFAQD
ncbi:bifunctional glutathionylspermidine amidase/synthase [Testudinibacter sp. TR-2022]|uniref:bifunctional glutathionylspermidine amidase/synthase n=1 Tax=Testudinibacter sp. TR-2022 TaxID=2585029 RepID=UPI00111B6943|nr:bifunctional glutathionylspermidine amidase/synthase [Testudinibacter sp. TR-2022]TNH06449.1 bifunctional glutathionylspermidine amidase/synthase [Pasteurellaceae bacterium Phil11]TNH24798.1 bifunctional glutathionylspermidine amidase/synthase [Testudinibacter sp. TR-2022]TNH29247.1 bifunctional glutathionylspermidine amidase/synthase [Testudinibacter sp. TR-2022]